MLKIEISFQNTNAAHKAAIMMETMECVVPPLVCEFCPYKDACALITEIAKALKEVKSDEE